MKPGVLFPQTEFVTDPDAVAEYAATAEDLGYDHLLTYEHVLGADPDRPGWEGGYDYTHQFHEPLTTFAFLAGATEELTLATSVLVLPQRQTALVAKQAAEVDVLTDGRLRLGVGVGWNDVEYEGMGADFHARGRRIEEQVPLLRRLWTERLVEFDGEFHTVDRAGINPLPVQQPIPVWMGGDAPPVLRRVGELADGWIPPGRSMDEIGERLDTVREHAREAGRDPDDIAVVGRLNLANHDPGAWPERVDEWAALGATHLAVGTVGMGHETPGEHVESVRRFREVVREAGVGLFEG